MLTRNENGTYSRLNKILKWIKFTSIDCELNAKWTE